MFKGGDEREPCLDVSLISNSFSPGTLQRQGKGEPGRKGVNLRWWPPGGICTQSRTIQVSCMLPCTLQVKTNLQMIAVDSPKKLG